MLDILLANCCRYEWYQTETHVVVSVLVKNVKKEDFKCDIQESSVSFQEKIILQQVVSLDHLLVYVVKQLWIVYHFILVMSIFAEFS